MKDLNCHQMKGMALHEAIILAFSTDMVLSWHMDSRFIVSMLLAVSARL